MSDPRIFRGIVPCSMYRNRFRNPNCLKDILAYTGYLVLLRI